MPKPEPPEPVEPEDDQPQPRDNELADLLNIRRKQEEATEPIRAEARAVSAFYLTLVNEGVPEDQAATLTSEWMLNLPPRDEPDAEDEE